MKNIFFAIIATLSLNGFSQSYFVLENGITLSLDSDGLIYDLGHVTPINRVTVKGGQYLVEDNNIIVTVDENGMFFRKYEILPKQILGKGLNYFLGEEGVLYGIDSHGVVNLGLEDFKDKMATKFGGNYFTTNSEQIYTVSSLGEHKEQKIEGLMPSEIIIFGGNYFMTNRGVLYSVKSDGEIQTHRNQRLGVIVKKGGNYFVDSSGALYTIAQDGSLKLPALPVSLRVAAISRLGSNYFLDGSGKIFTVDREGQVFERWTNYDLKKIKILSL